MPISNVYTEFSWKKFNDLSSDCGEVCQGIDYSVICREKDSGNDFTSEYPFTVLLGTSSASGDYTISFMGNKVSTLHGTFWDCKIEGVSIDSDQTAESNVFEVSFNACVRADLSCSLDTWSASKPTGWTAPQNLNVILDGSTFTTSFDYTNWHDKFYDLCGGDFCGVTDWKLVDENGVDLDKTTFAIKPALSISQTGDVITVSAATTDFATVGVYKVKALGTMTLLNGANQFAGPALTNTWSYFTITVVNPCNEAYPCDYATVIAPSENLLDMTAYFDNVLIS